MLLPGGLCSSWLCPGQGVRVGWWRSFPAIRRSWRWCRPGEGAVRLPPRRLSFVGRTADLAEVAARLGRYPVVTLTGVGGVGKTALAVEAAWAEVSAGRAERACYVDLVPCRTEEQVVAALVEGVGIRGAEAAAGLDAVIEAVSGCRSLLVLDNCEHVLEPARGACGQLAGRAADLRILVTSRIPLDIEPECVWRVQPMVVPGEAGHPVATEAVRLFYARAAMAGVTLQAGPRELVLAGGICGKAGGLPLALELVANRLRAASLAELATELGSSQWPARGTGSGRHDSLDACLAWSHALLPADAAAVFRRLSVFPAGFDLAAAKEVAGAPPVEAGQVGSLVGQLVTASLLEADTSGTRTRFRFLEPVRQYAAARLADAGEEDLARWRHARAFLARAETIEPMLFEPKAEQHCDLLELDRPDHDAALGWLLSCGAAGEAQRLAAALYFFWYTRGWFVTGLRWLRAALAAEAPGRSHWCGCVPRSGWHSWRSSLATTLPRLRPSSRRCRWPGCLATMWCWPGAWRPPVTSGGSWTRSVPPRFSRRASRLPTAAVMAGPEVPGWPGWAGPAITPHVSTRPSVRCRTLSS